MTKYRIIEAHTKGYYYVQSWEPPKWWRKGRWTVLARWKPGFLAYELPLYEAEKLLQELLHKEEKAKEQAEYLKQSRAVIREEETK